MTDQLNYSVRSQRIEDSFILFYQTHLFPQQNTSQQEHDVELT